MQANRRIRIALRKTSVLVVLVASFVLGCSDHGIREGDSQEIAALKRAGARIHEIPFSPNRDISVNLSGTGAGDSLMENFERLPNVQAVELKNAKITDASLAHLKPAAQTLTAIDLEGTNVTDQGLAALEGFPNLNGVTLSQTEISDEGLKHLAPLVKMRTLQLRDCKNVTDAGLKHLEGLTELEVVDLTGTGVTKQGVADLTKMVGPITFYQGP